MVLHIFNDRNDIQIQCQYIITFYAPSRLIDEILAIYT